MEHRSPSRLTTIALAFIIVYLSQEYLPSFLPSPTFGCEPRSSTPPFGPDRAACLRGPCCPRERSLEVL